MISGVEGWIGRGEIRDGAGQGEGKGVEGRKGE